MKSDPNSNPRLEQAAASDADIQSVHADLLHQKKEPSQGYSLMPLFMLGFVSTMIFVVAIYFIHHRGGLTDGLAMATMVQHERFDPDKHLQEVAAEVDPLVVGERFYTQVCAACHQMAGTGVPGIYPPLAGSEWVTGSEERLVRVLLHGLKGPIEVAGQSYPGAVVMPAFGPGGTYNWGDDRIAYVLTYIRSAWGNEAGEITPERVAEIRQAAADHSGEYTAEELSAFE